MRTPSCTPECAVSSSRRRSALRSGSVGNNKIDPCATFELSTPAAASVSPKVVRTIRVAPRNRSGGLGLDGRPAFGRRGNSSFGLADDLGSDDDDVAVAKWTLGVAVYRRNDERGEVCTHLDLTDSSGREDRDHRRCSQNGGSGFQDSAVLTA